MRRRDGRGRLLLGDGGASALHGALTVNHGVEAVDGIRGVLDGAAGAVGLHQAVAALNAVTVAALLETREQVTVNWSGSSKKRLFKSLAMNQKRFEVVYWSGTSSCSWSPVTSVRHRLKSLDFNGIFADSSSLRKQDLRWAIRILNLDKSPK